MSQQIVDICLCDMSPARKISAVPALVCSACDERMYSTEVSIRLDDIRERFGAADWDCDDVQPLLVYRFADREMGTPLSRGQDA